MHLLVIIADAPVARRGGAGAIGLVLLGVLTERSSRERAQRCSSGSAASRRSHSLLRHAEVMVGMGMAATAVAEWSRQHQGADAQAQHRLAFDAAWPRCAHRTPGGAGGAAGLGAWLVVGADASAGIMVAATMLARPRAAAGGAI